MSPVSDFNRASRWNAADYAANASFVPALGVPVVELLAPEAGEHILDVGAGNGVLTERIAASGATVIGIDASPDMVAAAQARGLDVRVGDAQALAFGPEFDAAFSNAALHWMLDRAGVAAGVFRALKPGGRFVGEMGGHGNVATIWRAVGEVMAERGYPVTETGSHWYPTVDDFTAVYAAVGFTDIEARLIPRPTPLPAGMAAWVRTFRQGLMDTAAVPAAEQDEIAEEVARRLEPALRDADGDWTADYVRLRFFMRKPV